MNPIQKDAPPAWALRAFGLLLAVIGAVLGWGGIELLSLGGSPYYLITGVALIASGVLLFLRKPLGLLVFTLVFIGTVIWSLAEVGLQFWPLMPRLAPVVVLGLVAALLAPCLLGKETRKGAWSLAAALAVVGLGGLASIFQPHGVIEASVQPQEHQKVPTATEGPDSQWQFYGRTPNGTRFSPLEQITRENVDQLEVAWTFRTGEENGPGTANKGSEDQNTPMQIGDTLYLCTPRNTLIALDADQGTEKWRFESGANSLYWNRCRGLGYYEVPTATASAEAPAEAPANAPASTAVAAAPALCERRVVMTTVDARLMQFDAATGAQCAGFGNQGTVDLKAGMGQVKQSYYFPTSAPTVVDNKVIVGGWVFDGREVDEPSGAVRAFDAVTGKLVWAWDLGNIANAMGPQEGGTYTRSTPNVWSTPAVDVKAGLIYLPTGNCPSDFFGGHKPAICDEYNASVVAVDLKTGKERWKFRTVNHDIWDYDIPAQPALYDIPDGKGGVQPALIQVTKRGQTFVLNRLTGEPLSKVEQKPVPQGHVEGERYAPTQPYSVDFPSLGFEPLSEAKMWGATWFDQLACRIKFKKLNYEGDFTPPMVGKPTIFYPGFLGGMNWGSVSINENNGYLIVNDVRIPNVVELVPRAEADQRKQSMGHGEGLHPQAGTPYASHNTPLVSPLGVPCQAPPWGTMSAIDLKTQQVVWQRPMGTVEDAKTAKGFGLGMHVPVGMPTLSGPISTASGLVFYAGTQDYYLRAMDVATGKELWRGRLPVGGQATPMTYVSPKTGTQYVALSVGGARTTKDRGDYVMAYKLKSAQ
jgi:quinate dehydrogenase (quinone)